MSGTWQRAPLKALRRTLLFVEEAVRRNQRSPIFFLLQPASTLPSPEKLPQCAPSLTSIKPDKLSRVSIFFFSWFLFFFPPPFFFFPPPPSNPSALLLTLDVQRHHLPAGPSLVLCLTGQVVQVVFSRYVGQVQDQHQRGAQDDLLKQWGWGSGHTRKSTLTSSCVLYSVPLRVRIKAFQVWNFRRTSWI